MTGTWKSAWSLSAQSHSHLHSFSAESQKSSGAHLPSPGRRLRKLLSPGGRQRKWWEHSFPSQEVDRGSYGGTASLFQQGERGSDGDTASLPRRENNRGMLPSSAISSFIQPSNIDLISVYSCKIKKNHLITSPHLIVGQNLCSWSMWSSVLDSKQLGWVWHIASGESTVVSDLN